MMKSLILLISLLAISCSPVKKYESLPEVQAWEDEIQKFEELDKSEIYSDDAIIFTGSSSIRLWSTLEADMAPYPVIQRGFGGSKLSDFAVYGDRIISPHKCKAIVIFIANDISGRETDKSPETVASLFRTSLRVIRKSHPGTPVFWIAITPTSSRWTVWPQIQKANNLIKNICEKEKNAYFIPTDYAFLNEKGLPKDELFVSDKLHLSQKGYEVWTGIIKKEINKIVPYPETEIIAHRGASYIAPENTVAAADLAWELGSDAVEVDIHMSLDNKIIVIHDANTKRTTGEDHTIKSTSSEILRKLDAGSFKDPSYRGEKIPFLEEIIQTIPEGKELVVEIKCGTEILPYLQETILKHGKDKKFVFIAFNLATITETKKMFPGNSCYWLCSDKKLLEQNISNIPKAGLEGISLNYSIINKAVASQAKELKLELYTWTVDDINEAKRLLSLGVKGITTNRPGWLNEQMFR
jgi:glycerophosphoryl diester phosphodiesterase